MAHLGFDSLLSIIDVLYSKKKRFSLTKDINRFSAKKMIFIFWCYEKNYQTPAKDNNQTVLNLDLFLLRTIE